MVRPTKHPPQRGIGPKMNRHPHRASAWPACCYAGVAVPALQHGGGSKLKRLLRVPLRLPRPWAPLYMNRGWPMHIAAHRSPWASPAPGMNPAADAPNTAAMRPSALAAGKGAVRNAA